jgi:hypothetical protein
VPKGSKNILILKPFKKALFSKTRASYYRGPNDHEIVMEKTL